MAAEVRVRYAPSPTGFQHIGNLRTALFNWLFARHERGKFIIRIEDTDRERSEEKYVTQILDDFRWLGIDWDEGPDVGGDYGPYRQSERLAIYQEHADRLRAEGKAYRCYCTPEELEARRQTAKKTGRPPEDTRCRELSAEGQRKLEAEGRPPSIRFRVGEDRKITFDDLVLGATTFDSRQIGDFVVLKSDGWPTYHFGVVVDDWLMKISHVIRAEGHLSNTPLHVMLMDALGFKRPEFAHLPSVLSADGKGKLSKRLGALSLVEYRKQGYLPEALMNFMALLGWSPGDNREIMIPDERIESIESVDQQSIVRNELVKSFDLKRVKKASARFDTQKLLWMNQKYLNNLYEADLGRLLRLASEALNEAGIDVSALELREIWRVVNLYHGSIKTLADFAEQARFFFVDDITYDPKAVEKILDAEGIGFLRQAYDALKTLDNWTNWEIEKVLTSITPEIGKVAQPIRVAITGTKVSKGIFDTLSLLGDKRSLKRIKDALEKFGKAED